MSEEIETIDLCTQFPISNRNRTHNCDINDNDEVLADSSDTSSDNDIEVIPDSDEVLADSSDTSSDNDIEVMSEEIETVDLCTQFPISNASVPQKTNRENNRHAPYVRPSSKSEKGIRCPICFRTAKNHEPVSTQCGHIYCKNCISATMQARVEQTCPMCKMELPKENPFHRIFI